MKCFTENIAGHQVMCSRYDVNKDIGFCFHLMAEVGAPYQKQMRALANSLASARKSVIRTIELDQAPWYADVMEKRK